MSLDPRLADGEYVFCSLPEDRAAGLRDFAVCTFREAEGITLVLPRDVAGALQLPCEFPCRLISLGAYTALDAVGILARIAAALAAAGIPSNAVSAFHHDHLFVPTADAERALRLLQTLSL